MADIPRDRSKEHLERCEPSLLILVALELLANLDVRGLFTLRA
jgi:hypothetical protein